MMNRVCIVTWSCDLTFLCQFGGGGGGGGGQFRSVRL